uniref:Uncharacterized protein n=1 Tax=Rhizophora mucronata TaxID=61149 RepID=A0A2P2KRZ5_RHIMU
MLLECKASKFHLFFHTLSFKLRFSRSSLSFLSLKPASLLELLQVILLPLYKILTFIELFCIKGWR